MTPDEARALITELETLQNTQLSPVDRELWAAELLPHEHPVGRLAVCFAHCIYVTIPTLAEFVHLLEREAALWSPPRLIEEHHEVADAETTRSGLDRARAALKGPA